jgi:hypothetical protein
MTDVTASGFTAIVKASKTFPNGLPLSFWADDTDPFDIPELVIAEAAMNLNGNLVTWTAPKPIPIKLALIPGSEDDVNMQILFDANRAALGKRIARDSIDIVVAYPDGATATFSAGIITTGMPGRSPTSGGRFKSQTYGFTFENIAYTRAKAQ